MLFSKLLKIMVKKKEVNFLNIFLVNNGYLIIDLIFEINDVSKLYDSIDYFVKDNFYDIKKYILMKYLLEKKLFMKIKKNFL